MIMYEGINPTHVHALQHNNRKELTNKNKIFKFLKFTKLLKFTPILDIVIRDIKNLKEVGNHFLLLCNSF